MDLRSSRDGRHRVQDGTDGWGDPGYYDRDFQVVARDARVQGCRDEEAEALDAEPAQAAVRDAHVRGCLDEEGVAPDGVLGRGSEDERVLEPDADSAEGSGERADDLAVERADVAGVPVGDSAVARGDEGEGAEDADVIGANDRG
jgi:hypothetical protein